jgi:hypothetical protein
MRINFVMTAAFLLASGVAHADPFGCDAVLIPSINSFESFTRKTLDTLHVVDDAQSLNKDQKQKYAVTVPIYGIPVQFGYENNNSSQFRRRTLDYFQQNQTQEDAVWALASQVPEGATKEWADCMRQNRHPEIMAYFNAEVTTSDNATFYVKRFKTGNPPPPSNLQVKIDGGTVQDKKGNQTQNYVNTEFKVVGDERFDLHRNHNARVTVQVSLDNSPAITIVIPKEVAPPKIPEVRIRMWGHLQGANFDETFPPKQYELSYSPGVAYLSNDFEVHVEELVDGKLCDSKIMNQNDEGDAEISHIWRLDRLAAECEPDASPTARKVKCKVDPKYFTECP